MMNTFQYRITRHPAETFRDVVYFCNEEGGCSLERVSSEQTGKVEQLLNDMGKEGWELVQASFGKDGLLIFWKRLTVDGAPNPA